MPPLLFASTLIAGLVCVYALIRLFEVVVDILSDSDSR